MEDFQKVRAIPDVRFTLEFTGQIDPSEKLLAILRKSRLITV
jgi:hypothetical protein